MTDIFFENDHILIRSEYRAPDIHKHLASHMAFCLEGELDCIVNNISLKCRGIFIKSDVDHTIYAKNGDMLIFLFDTTSDMSKRIERQFLKEKDYFLIDAPLVDQMVCIWDEYGANLKEADKRILKECGITELDEIITDERILKVLSYLENIDSVSGNIMSRLCSEACLSESRLSHLFKEQMGIALGRYFVLEKMKKGYIHFERTGNITEAALNAGFDSPSHFAATCRRMFGISFSEFIKS